MYIGYEPCIGGDLREQKRAENLAGLNLGDYKWLTQLLHPSSKFWRKNHIL